MDCKLAEGMVIFFESYERELKILVAPSFNSAENTALPVSGDAGAGDISPDDEVYQSRK
jgi:hypothetical protein